MGMRLTEISPPDPGHVSLAGGTWFVEITCGTRGLIYNGMRLVGEGEGEGDGEGGKWSGRRGREGGK